MSILTVCNHKGGSGKTTSVLHIATALGLLGHDVLVIDLDPQGFLTRQLGVHEPPEWASSLALFALDAHVDQIPQVSMRHFSLLPSSTMLTKAMRKLTRPTDTLWLKETLQKGYRQQHVLIDTAAAITVYSINALVAGHHVLIPVTPEYQPVVGAEQTFQSSVLIREKLNPKLDHVFFLLTNVDARKNSHTHYRAYLRKKYGAFVLDSYVRTSTSLSNRSDGGETVFDRDLSARGAVDYANVTDELMQKMSGPPNADAGPFADVSREKDLSDTPIYH